MTTITPEATEAICAVIDRVKLDDRSLDTNEYAGMIVEALDGTMPPTEHPDERECEACGFDFHPTKHGDELCWVCRNQKMCENCLQYTVDVETAYGMEMCAACQHDAKRSGA